MLGALASEEVFGFMLVFARLGTAISLLPGFGEPYVFQRVRLGIALGVTLAVWGLVRGELPAMPAEPFRLTALVGGEMLLGAMLGAAARIIVSALHIAGVIVAFQTGLAYAQTVDPNQGVQGGLVAALFGLLGIVLVFAAGLHAPLLAGLADSYKLFPPGTAPPFQDFAATATHLMAAAFLIGVQMAAPFVLMGLVFYAGLGLMQRMMPQLQLIFLAMPLQIMLSLGLMMLVLSASMLWFLDRFRVLSGGLMAPA